MSHSSNSHIALITMIESNKNNLNKKNGFTFKHERLYEDEAILCFENWRKNGGWLKDIKIYVYCPTENTISEETKAAFQKLNVNYIEKFHEETKTFFSGFMNVPFCGMVFEETLAEEIFIHIDLDMNLIQPIPEELFTQAQSGKIIVGQYDINSAKMQRNIGQDWELPLDTGFIISPKSSGFYHYFYNNLVSLVETSGDERWKRYCQDQPLYFLEEYLIDHAYNNKILPILPIQKYQIGEGYAPVKSYTDEELQKVLFWHEHILYESSSYDKIREKIEFTKRTKRFK